MGAPRRDGPADARGRARGLSRLRALATGVALGAYILVGTALIIGKGYHVDSVAVVHRATEIFTSGQDLYVDLNAVEALRHFGLDPTLATNLEDGSDVTTYNYPRCHSSCRRSSSSRRVCAMSRFLYLGEIVNLSLLLICEVRVPCRPLATAAIVGNAIIMLQNVLAGIDPVWAVFTVLAFLFVAGRRSLPILIGLAPATRQPAWCFAPFYLMTAWKRDGRREVVRRTAIGLVAGTISNLPFFVISPGALVGGVLMPTLGPLEPYGVGLIRFALDREIPLIARGVYGALSITAMAVLVVVLWRWWRKLPNGMVVFPSMVVWFA